MDTDNERQTTQFFEPEPATKRTERKASESAASWMKSRQWLWWVVPFVISLAWQISI